MNMKRNPAAQIPQAFVPLLGNDLDRFIIKMEKNRLILEPKPEATKRAPAVAKPEPVARPVYTYTARDRRMTPEMAERYGLSPTRLKVFGAIYKAKDGLQAREIMKICKLPHGSVQQTLNWLRNHSFVTHSVKSTAK